MKRIAVLTSGGDAPGMNPAIRAVVRAGIGHGLEVFGIQRGYQGLIDGAVEPMTARSVSGIIHHGGTILRTARCRDFMDEAGRARAAAQLRSLGIDGLVVIGGDGSYRGAHALWKEHGVACVGIPGTIDNDIGGTQYTIGFDTALNTAVEAIDRLRDTAASHDRIFFVEVMGRHSGYIAMYSGLAGGAEAVLAPENPTDVAALVEELREMTRRGKTSMIVVVAEGDDAGIAALEKELLAQNATHQDWCSTTELMEKTANGQDTIFMHPLPADISGVSCEHGEVNADVFDMHRVGMYKEASYKPYAIAAMMFLQKVADSAATLKALDERNTARWFQA